MGRFRCPISFRGNPYLLMAAAVVLSIGSLHCAEPSTTTSPTLETTPTSMATATPPLIPIATPVPPVDTPTPLATLVDASGASPTSTATPPTDVPAPTPGTTQGPTPQSQPESATTTPSPTLSGAGATPSLTAIRPSATDAPIPTATPVLVQPTPGSGPVPTQIAEGTTTPESPPPYRLPYLSRRAHLRPPRNPRLQQDQIPLPLPLHRSPARHHRWEGVWK